MLLSKATSLIDSKMYSVFGFLKIPCFFCAGNDAKMSNAVFRMVICVIANNRGHIKDKELVLALQH